MACRNKTIFTIRNPKHKICKAKVSDNLPVSNERVQPLNIGIVTLPVLLH
jgi:hypothetical protein